MRLTLTIDIDDDDLAAELRRFARVLEAAGKPDVAESGRPGGAGSCPHDPGRTRDVAESGHPPGSDPDAPRTGRELLGWADRHGRKNEAVRVARTLRFGTRLVSLSDDQARQVYAEMRQYKPARGSQAWGGSRVAGAK